VLDAEPCSQPGIPGHLRFLQSLAAATSAASRAATGSSGSASASRAAAASVARSKSRHHLTVAEIRLDNRYRLRAAIVKSPQLVRLLG
jgi:hypothetical protein